VTGSAAGGSNSQHGREDDEERFFSAWNHIHLYLCFSVLVQRFSGEGPPARSAEYADAG
jgi:hypothetical protein